MTHDKTTLSIKIVHMMTLGIVIFVIVTLGLTTLGITTYGDNDTWRNNT